MSDDAPRSTQEMVNDIVDATTTETASVVGSVQSGRRAIDWHALFTWRDQVSIFFWLFGMFLDERHKPSMSRIMLAFWTWVGWKMIQHELILVAGVPSLQNAAWNAWWAAEGVLTLSVFGPGLASYFGPGAAGTAAMSAIGSSANSNIAKVRDIVARKIIPPTPPEEDKK